MIDESLLTEEILRNFEKCLEVRAKYINWSLQKESDNPINQLDDHNVLITCNYDLSMAVRWFRLPFTMVPI